MADYHNSEPVCKTRRIFAVLRLALLAFIIVGGSVFLYFKFGNNLFSRDSAGTLISYLEANRSASFAILIALQAVQVIVCIIPGQPIQIAGSYLFGIPGSLFTSLTGAVIGSALSFYMARLIGRGAVHDLFGEERISPYSEKLNSPKALIIIFIIYLIPGLPKDLMSYAAGISEVSFIPFIVLSTIARTPAMMGSILFGFFFRKQNYTAIIILCVVSAIIAIVCIILRKRIISWLEELAKHEAKRAGKAM